MNRPSARANKKTGVIEIPKSKFNDWKKSPAYAEYCWREVVQMMMMMIPAEQIQEENPEMWEKAFEHAAIM